MSKRLLTAIFCVIVTAAMAQDRKGYFAFAGGIGSVKEYDGGTNFSPLSFGYTPKLKGLGLTLGWSTGSNSKGTLDFNYNMVMIGPMYTIKLAEKSVLELKPRAGYFLWKEHITPAGGKKAIRAEGTGLGLCFGATFQQLITPGFAIMLSVDDMIGPKGTSYEVDDRYKVLGITAGIALYFKSKPE